MFAPPPFSSSTVDDDMRKSGEVRAEEDGIENPLLMAISIAAATSIDWKSAMVWKDDDGTV